MTFIGMTVEEMGPGRFRSYGAVGERAAAELAKIHDDLERLVDQAAAYVRRGLGRDLQERIVA